MTLSTQIPNYFKYLFSSLLIFASSFTQAQISQVGAHTTASGTDNITTINIDKPTGVQVGDLLILNIIKYSPTNTEDPTINSDGTAGWTLLAGSGIGGSNNYRGAIMYKVVTETWEPTTYEIITSYWPADHSIQAAIVAYRGVDINNPFDVTGSFVSAGTSGNSISLPAITTSTVNTLVVQLSMSWRSNNNNSRSYSTWATNSPGNLTEIYDFSNFNRVRLGAAARLKTNTGSTGTSTISLSGNSTYRGGMMLALNPAPPIIVSTVSTETCIGGNTGSITVTATEGNIPYTYSLNGGTPQSSNVFGNLAAGTYTVLAIDNLGREGNTTSTVATPLPSTDNQNAAGTNAWIGHVYDGTNFNTYYGSYAQTETFDENFGGATTCFPFTSNGVARSIYTTTFSVRYRMNSTKKGLYVVDLGSDDGSRLTIDGVLLHDNWVDQAYSSRPRVLMNLTGTSSLVYDFNENGGENRVVFQNLTPVLANNLTSNLTQTINIGTSGAAISGDVFGTLPSGISLSGTGYQWTYSTTLGGARTTIAGATGATFTPNATAAPFSTAGTYYIFRNAVLSSANNVSPNPYTATSESNHAILVVNSNPLIIQLSQAQFNLLAIGF